MKFDFTKEEDRFKLGRALYHIAQRRGFKSSRKGADDIKEKAEIENQEVEFQYSERKKSNKLKELFPDFDSAIPIGVFLANKENEGKRLRLDITQYLVRQNYKDEISYIFQFQGLLFTDSIYCSLVETGKNKNDGSIFYKRPLRSQKGLIGKCTLEQSKYRAPISHPSFEIFRAWSFLNNIKYKPADDSDGQWKPLSLELKAKVYNKLFFRKKAYFPFSDIADLLEKEGKKLRLNYKPRTTVTGCPVSARLKDIFGDDYLNIKIPKVPSPKSKKNYYDIDDIWHVLFSFEDQEYIVEFAQDKLKINPEQTKQFITTWNAIPVGYAMLSLNAINKINIFLQKGLIYPEAVLLANIPEIIGKDLWAKNEIRLIAEIGKVIDENREQKTILNIVNTLISKHKNLPDAEKFGMNNKNYKLDESDMASIEETIKEQFGERKWSEKLETERYKIASAVKDCYQAYFVSNGLERKDIHNERYFVVKANNAIYYKSDSGYYRLPKLIDTLGEFLQLNFNVSDDKLNKIYHPSEINIYPPAKADKDGVLKLGSPKTGSFKNPMAMRALHELRKLINYMIETSQIDSDTRIVVEVARELNDANKRWAIEAWQKQREAENAEFALAIEQLIRDEKGVLADSSSSDDIDKMRIWYEQNDEETIPAIAEGKKDVKGIKWTDSIKNSYKEIAAKKEMVDKYRLWREQNCQCFYTGTIIKITDLFKENVIDFEHTIPRSLSFDNSLANLTVCYADYNRNVKKNQIPFNLNNYNEDYGGYSAILPRLDKWQEKVERIKQQIDYWVTKAKRAGDKDGKDFAIRQRHLWQMEFEYWRNKVDRFTMEEVTSGFKNSQKVDTQLISKYAFHYLKTYFEKVDVQKGRITAEFRKIYSLQVADEKKDRSKHSHHAKDAAVLTLIPVAAKRDEILKTYYEHQEKRQTFSAEPYKGFKREFVWGIDDSILINNITNNQALTPAKRIIRKRGKVQFIEGTQKPMIATGDAIRGQLHDETFFGAIKPAKRGEKGNIIKDEEGNMIQGDIRFVVRVPFLFKKDTNSPGFKTLEDIEKQIVDEGLKRHISEQVEKAGGLKEAFEKGFYHLDKNGNPIKADKNGRKINSIRHIRIFKAVTEPLQIKKQTNLSKHGYKQFYYAGNASNIAYGLYKNSDDTKVGFKIIDLFTASKINKITGSGKLELETEIAVGKQQLILQAILASGQKVIFYKDDKYELQNLSVKEISNRTYKIEGFEKDGRVRLTHHLNAMSDNDLKTIDDRKAIYQGFSSIDFENPWPKLKLSMGNLKMAIENKDFKMKMDGSIQWS